MASNGKTGSAALAWPQATRKMDVPRQVTDWRLWRSVTDDLKAGFKACFPTRIRLIEDYLRSIAERPCQQQLQSLPAPIRSLIEKCRLLGVSHV